MIDPICDIERKKALINHCRSIGDTYFFLKALEELISLLSENIMKKHCE